MAEAPSLLDEAGAASVATAVMMSHHGFRRDLVRFAAALETLAAAGPDRLAALGDEWRSFRNTLHGHHHAEDTGVFPYLASQHAALLDTLEQLKVDHQRIDPVLERGDRAFADLPRAAAAANEAVRDLSALLDPHLASEELHVIPHLRDLKDFPTPANDEEAALLTDGFAWACHGIAPDVLERVYVMLQPSVAARLPAARAAFEARWRRVWGPVPVGAARTPIPARPR